MRESQPGLSTAACVGRFASSASIPGSAAPAGAWWRSRAIGYAFLACGSLATDDKATLATRLVAIHDGLRRVVAEHAPDEAAVEATFVNKDAVATLKLGQARGIAMLVPAIAGLPVAEYAPNLVKKTIVGAGHSEKLQIRMMIRVLLPKAEPKSDDAADALAIAVCHAHHRQSAMLKMRAE